MIPLIWILICEFDICKWWGSWEWYPSIMRLCDWVRNDFGCCKNNVIDSKNSQIQELKRKIQIEHSHRKNTGLYKGRKAIFWLSRTSLKTIFIQKAQSLSWKFSINFHFWNEAINIGQYPVPNRIILWKLNYVWKC
jgi:hypothetical protein